MAAAVLVSPYLPMLFMGEEYGETNPFLYFVSHTDAELAEAVRKGRKENLQLFMRKVKHQILLTKKLLMQSKLQWHLLNRSNMQTCLPTIKN